MAFNLVLLDIAETELWEAVDFYDSQRTDLGKSFAREVDNVLKLVRANPNAFPKVHHTRADKTRSIGRCSLTFMESNEQPNRFLHQPKI